MNVYRDDLTAARQRIRALEDELKSIQRREATPLTSGARSLARPGSSRASAAFAIVGVLVVGFVALRVPAIAPVALVAFLVAGLVIALRGRTIVVRPNEVAVLKARSKDASERIQDWVGPGRVARLRRSVEVESLCLRAAPVSWTADSVATETMLLDLDLFAVVAIRRDEEGIERALRTFGTGPLAPLVQAALEDALRACARDTPSSHFLEREAGLRDRLRRKGRESLDELGVKLITIGVVDAREHAEIEGKGAPA